MIAVLFEAEVTPASQERYLALAAELKPLLNDIDGFIAIERFQSLSTAGKILSLSGGGMRTRCWHGNATFAIRLRRKRGGRAFSPVITFEWLRCCANTVLHIPIPCNRVMFCRGENKRGAMLKPVELIEDDESLAEAMAVVASAMADASRLKILCALMDGRAWTATELSAVADISLDRQRAS